jgi:SAM-dependent methyltransferase
MLLTISTTLAPATDLGYLLHKHPAKAQTFDVSVGTAHVVYPEATEARCTAALLLEIDPVGLVRGRKGSQPEQFALGQYVNDRPYAASSMLAVALGRVFRTAMSGRCDARPELAAAPIPLQLRVPVLPCRGGTAMAERLLGPLGWRVEATPVPLDPEFPAWGDSRYLDLRLTGEVRLADALSHLYVLLPVLDDAKHYWVSPDEVDKLVRAGEGWLAGHPDRNLVTRRYLSHSTRLFRAAIDRLAEVDDATEDELLDATTEAEVHDTGAASPDGTAATPDGTIPTPDGTVPAPADPPADPTAPADAGADRPLSLAVQRHGAVLAALRTAGARSVADLGCGGGALLAKLLDEPGFTRVMGVDVSARALELAARKLRLERMPTRRRERLELFQSSLVYRDRRLAGFDAAVLMEVVEHVDPPRLAALERTVFGHAAPGTVVVTTPNVEHNVRFEGLAPGSLRHRDHRFEWTRAEFRAWAERVAAEHGYGVRLVPVGVDDPEVGPPTQMAVFTRTMADLADPKAAGTGTGQPPAPSTPTPTSTPTLPGFEPAARTTATTGGGTR